MTAAPARRFLGGLVDAVDLPAAAWFEQMRDAYLGRLAAGADG